MSPIGRSHRLRRALRWCRNGALCGALFYAVLGFLALNVTPGPDSLDTASVLSVPGDPGALFAATTSETSRGSDGTVLRGVLSVHTGRSHDAQGTLTEVAAAARNTNLDFVVLGDHPGLWSERGEEVMVPHRREGVLIVPGLELVISGVGRTLAVGLDTLPRRWEGTVEDLVQRADSLQAFLSVVHPRSPRSRERWNGLDAPGVHAWESFDVSEMARIRLKEPWAAYHLASFVGGLLVGKGEGSLAALWRERTRTPALLSYDSVRAVQPVTLTGGLNHHPKARLGGLLFPRYEPFFRTVVNHVLLPGPISEDPDAARGQLLDALRAGRLFVTLGDPDGADEFRVWGVGTTRGVTEMGGRAPWIEGAGLHIRLPGGVRGELLVRILRDGEEADWLRANAGETLFWTAATAGVYRVEVFRGGLRMGRARVGFRPWILSNPVEFYHGDTDRLALNP
jgi:hypothetical protein